MTPNIHVHLHVTDLARSCAFYARLFGGAPVKVKAGYAKFLPGFAPLNLALTEVGAAAAAAAATGGARAGGTTSHLGIQFDSPDAIRAHLARVRAAGLAVRVELDVDCCHANQDKFWATDPDGVEWELYFLRRDLEEVPLPVVAPTCCANAPSAEPARPSP